MTQLPPTQRTRPTVTQVKPQPNVYTVLIIVAILALAISIGFGLHNLMGQVSADGGYGMTFGEVFNPSDKGVVPGK